MTKTREFFKVVARKFPRLASICRVLRYGPHIIESPEISVIGFQFT